MRKPKMNRADYNRIRGEGYHFTSSEMHDGEPDDTYYLNEKAVSGMFSIPIVAVKSTPIPCKSLPLLSSVSPLKS